MLRVIFCVLIFVTAIVSLFCGQKEQSDIRVYSDEKLENVGYSELGHIEHNRIIINLDVDLKGGECKIPAGRTLVFKGGVIKNGIITGKMTKIECKGKAFDKVTIKGSWNVPEISTRLFADLSYENALRDVVALAHPKVKNSIVIEKGEYKVNAEKNKDVCIPICGNTDLIIKGTIRLAPNDLKSCDIIQAKGVNINIEGNGTIIGDKHTHTGNEGEWGMGINLKGAIDTTISGLTIKDCWGDCIYVGGNSKNVLIECCKLDHGRRQGISITKADGVTIRNCVITNVSGTNPQYAIDVEPNRRDSVDNILIEKVTVKDCEGGFAVTRRNLKDGAKTPWIGNVTIRNCDVKCKKKYPVGVKRCEKIEIKDCKLYAPDGVSAISVVNTGEAEIKNNYLSTHFDIVDDLKNKIREIVGKGRNYPINIRTTKNHTVLNNKIISRR
jgi:parallel beta-helix repeat protein